MKPVDVLVSISKRLARARRGKWTDREYARRVFYCLLYADKQGARDGWNEALRNAAEAIGAYGSSDDFVEVLRGMQIKEEKFMHATVMKVNRGLFLSALTSVKAGLSPREVLEQSSCVVFGKGRVMTFNDEVSCSAPTGLPEEYRGAVQAKPLLDILSRFPEEEVELTLSRQELEIRGKGRSAGVRMDRTVLLPVDSVEDPEEWKPLPPEFAEAAGMVATCVGHDASQYHLTCVHVHPRWVEACDNMQLCRWKVKTPVEAPVLLGGDAIAQVVTLGVTEFGETQAWMHFRNPAGLIISCRKYMEHDFPDVSKLLEVGGSPATLPRSLAEEADRAGVFSQETENKMVLIELRPGKLRIRGHGVTGWYEARSRIVYDGVPMRFFIGPKVLTDLLKRHTQCVISEDKIKVTAGGYTWLGCLMRPPDEEQELGPKKPRKAGKKVEEEE